MLENLPSYVSIVFILTTFLTVGFLFRAIKATVIDTIPAQILIFLISFWIFCPAILAIYGFINSPKLFRREFSCSAHFPRFLVAIIYIIFFRKNFVAKLPLKTLTLLHIIRIPVEIVLLWLFQNSLIPQEMTFEGRNFDILSGITAPIVYFFRLPKQPNKPHIANYLEHFRTNFADKHRYNRNSRISISNAINRPFPTQPRRDVFPYIWLPALIVPIVFFSHLAAFVQLFKKTFN